MPRDGYQPAPSETASAGHDQVPNINDSSLNVSSSTTTTDPNGLDAMTCDATAPSLPSNHDSAMEKPLPLGWEIAIAPNGKKYYLDHNSRTTTWTRPAPDLHPQKWVSDEDLPAGWEIRYCSKHNRKYYVDHNTRSTSWIPPREDREEVMPSPQARESGRTSGDSLLQGSHMEENRAAEREKNALANGKKGEDDVHTVSLGEDDSWELMPKL